MAALKNEGLILPLARLYEQQGECRLSGSDEKADEDADEATDGKKEENSIEKTAKKGIES